MHKASEVAWPRLCTESLPMQTKFGCGVWSVDVMGPSKQPRNGDVVPRVLQLTIRGMLKPKSRHNDYAEYII